MLANLLWQSPNKCEIFAGVSTTCTIDLIIPYFGSDIWFSHNICSHLFSHIHFGWGFALPWWAIMTIAFHFHHNHHISCGYHPCCCLRWLCLGLRKRNIRSFLKELSQKQGHDLSTTSLDISKLADKLIITDTSVRDTMKRFMDSWWCQIVV